MHLRSPLSRWLSVLLLLSLTACGGGGGGGGGSDEGAAGGGGNSTSVTVPARSYTLTTHHDAFRQPEIAVDFSLARVPDTGIGVDVQYDSPAITYGDVIETGATTGQILLRLASGSALAAGEHIIPVRVSFCYDEACARHVTGSPVTVSLKYDVRPADRKVRIEVIDAPAVRGLLADAQGPTSSAQIRVVNPPEEGISFRLATGNSLVDSTRTETAPDGYRLALQFTRPANLGLGAHTATPFLEACYASQCGVRTEIDAGRLALAYTVTAAPIADTRIVDLAVSDFEWDPLRSWIYFTLGSGSGRNSDRGVLDPVTGGIYLDPNSSGGLEHLSLSPDGVYLVAGSGGTVSRYRRDDLVLVDSTFGRTDLADPTADRVEVSDLQYGADGTVAVLTTSNPDRDNPGRGTRLLLLDGVTRRGDTYSPSAPSLPKLLCSFSWGEPGGLFASAGYDGLVPLSATPTGLVAGPTLPGDVHPTIPTSPFSCHPGMRYAAGRLFSRDGFVVRGSDGTTAGVLAADFAGSARNVKDVVIDEALRRVFVLHVLGTDQSGDARVTAYSLDTLQRLDSVVVRNAGQPTKMIRWGARGLALRNLNGKLLLIEISVVNGS